MKTITIYAPLQCDKCCYIWKGNRGKHVLIIPYAVTLCGDCLRDFKKHLWIKLGIYRVSQYTNLTPIHVLCLNWLNKKKVIEGKPAVNKNVHPIVASAIKKHLLEPNSRGYFTIEYKGDEALRVTRLPGTGVK